jgi:hypothetical protein
MGGDGGLEDFAEVGLEAGARSLLVGLAQADIADDIGDEHGGEPALHGAGLRFPADGAARVDGGMIGQRGGGRHRVGRR